MNHTQDVKGPQNQNQATPSQISLDPNLLVLKQTAKSGSVAEVQSLLEGPSLISNAGQRVLEYSALAGNSSVFRYMLHRQPDPHLGEALRFWAVQGGVQIWKILLEFKPECIDWPIGHEGDALGLAVLRRNTALARFLLEKGINVEESHYMYVPVYDFAKQRAGCEEIMDLLVKYNAPR